MPELKLLSQSTLTTPISGGRHIACNPTIDLTATAGDANSTLYVWRANDQVVSKHSQRGAKVEAIRWKEDGQFLACGWSDGVVRLSGLESSKTVHNLRVKEKGGGGIEFLGWGRNVTRRKRRGVTKELGRIALEDEREVSLVDLPHELTFLEVENALPRLSPLPVSGGSGDDMFLFSTTASLEVVFRPCRAEEADDVHVMIVGTTDGGIHLSIYDSFVIGTFQYSILTAPGQVFQLCGHSSRPDMSTHMLLLKPKDGDGTTVHVVPLDLIFVHYSPVNLSLLASKTTTLQNVLRYIKQAQSHMAGEWKSTRELPSRFLNGVEDDLKKMPNGGLNIVQALYHTVATGHIFAPVKEWLVDIVAERGHKRWEKAVVTGLLNLRALVHENFIPALERCGIILSRLLGIARFHDTQENIGFRPAQISKLIDIVSCLMVAAHKILLGVMDELEHFTAFSIWLRLEIDKQASSTVNEELTEKEATMDNAKVMTYIQRYLVSSPLAMYFEAIGKEDYERDQQLLEDSPSILQVLEQQLKKQEAGESYMKTLPHVDFLVDYLTSRSSMVFQNIAEAEKRGVHFGEGTSISVGQKIWKHDIHMCGVADSEEGAQMYTALVTEADKSSVYLFETNVSIVSGVSTPPHTTAYGVKFPKNTSIVDFSFLDEKSLLLLCHQKEKDPAYSLVRLEYRTTNIPRKDYVEGQPPALKALRSLNSAGVCSSTTFAHLAGFSPVQMVVQKSSNARGKMPGRVCLVGRDRGVYKTYALPKEWEDSAQ
ncbi:anaphase-promoting complex subunit 4 [Podospora australis]|uniref:Anaphase-promoting complex subunit 4 n=1 Tax=Podospora australis TaxID=1536484 RepID=A0AAN6X1N7_9PEZI|nr:anaphase-promoting complex subunit 4 [Podospora australis]